ncbi:hypothetical protein PVT01_000022100 [Plasmodium vivax]|uniref:Uncharacterized protein n=1 Tax=Plasmodium vivax TaxID=5855 RepID=A0A1G4E3F8_PLAVI|nr:hypothetical protein PVT01_000022100 [Plasmodium vivax]
MDRPLDHSEYSSPSTLKKSITSAVSAAGVLVPPFVIYNYAPARSWINKLLGMNKGEAEKSPLPARTEITVGQKHYRPGLSETGQFVENLSALHPGLLEENPVMASASDHPEDSSPSTIKKSITSAVSAAGVLVPPFLIYNYAPARSWIYKLLGMNKGTNRNPYANQELMADFSMPQEEFPEYLSALNNGVLAENTYAPARSWINKLLGMNKGPSRNPYANQEIMADFSMPEDFYSERNRYNIMYNPE